MTALISTNIVSKILRLTNLSLLMTFSPPFYLLYEKKERDSLREK